MWTALKAVFPISIEPDEVVEQAGGETRLTSEMLLEEILSDARIAYQSREEQLGSTNMRQLERRVTLSVLDRKWREHLYEMDYLKEGIGLRAMAQRDPLVEYQREGFQLFQAMTEAIKEETVGYLFNLEVKVAEPGAADPAQSPAISAAAAAQAAQSAAGQALGGAAGAASAGAAAGLAAAAQQSATQDAPVEDAPVEDAPVEDAPVEDAPVEAPEPVTAPAAFGGPSGGDRPGTLIAKGLDGPDRQVPLSYSAPSEDGTGQAVVSGDASRRSRRALHGEATAVESDGRTFPGTPRNAQCPCGSGKKYKVCHGQNEE